jgi:hypothetical protein
MGVGSVVLALVGNLLTAPIGKAASAAVGWAMKTFGTAEAAPSIDPRWSEPDPGLAYCHSWGVTASAGLSCCRKTR